MVASGHIAVRAIPNLIVSHCARAATATGALFCPACAQVSLATDSPARRVPERVRGAGNLMVEWGRAEARHTESTCPRHGAPRVLRADGTPGTYVATYFLRDHQ